MIDVVVSEATNPLMSGVGRFNQQLARRLGVPYRHLSDAGRPWQHPMLSGKPAAWSVRDARQWGLDDGRLDLFLHDWPTTVTLVAQAESYVRQAGRVFAANQQIAAAIRPVRPDVREAHCPGLIEASGPLPTAELCVFSFGMGHKRSLEHYRRLHALLTASGHSFCLCVSAGLHEDTRCPDTPFLNLEALFRPAVFFLGILSDRLIAHWLATATYVAQFFPDGLRANNTTVNAALAADATVITNCDAWTPPTLRAAVLDIRTASELIPPPLEARRAAADAMSWDRLLAPLRTP